MTPSPFLVQIGPLAIRWYSVMIVLGAVAAAWIANREARRRGQDPEHVWQLLPWVLVLGIIGARLGWVVVSLKEIEAQGGWQHAFAVWDGGLSIQGAVIGGLLAAVFYCRRAGLDFWEWTDIVVPGLALAQAIGRWGNYFNQELFGEPCTQPWCIPIQDSILQSHPQYVQYVGQNLHFAPTFAYEMIWNLLNFGLLMYLGRQRRFELRTGDLFWVYGIFYSIGRFFLEDVRLDSVIINGIKPPQAFALLTIAICWIGLIYRHRPGSTAPVAVVADESAAWAEADEDTESEADDEAYEVDTDEDGNPVEPVLHPDPIVAQTEST